MLRNLQRGGSECTCIKFMPYTPSPTPTPLPTPKPTPLQKPKTRKKEKTISKTKIRSGILSHFRGFLRVFHRVLHRLSIAGAKKPPLLGEVGHRKVARRGFRRFRLPLSQKSEIFDSSPTRGAFGVWKSKTVNFQLSTLNCQLSKIGEWDKNGTTNHFFCGIIVSSKKAKSGNLLGCNGFSLFVL